MQESAAIEISTLSLHEALPISALLGERVVAAGPQLKAVPELTLLSETVNWAGPSVVLPVLADRKGTRLTSTHFSRAPAVYSPEFDRVRALFSRVVTLAWRPWCP